MYTKWSGWLARIKKQQLRDLLINRHIFKQLKECTAAYVETKRGATLSEWMVQNYIAFAATGVRRMIEEPNRKSKRRSISLVILLEDMAENDRVLTRGRFCNLYTNPIARPVADRAFDAITRDSGATLVSAARIQQDLDDIKKACAPIKLLADKVVAHTEEDHQKIGKTKYGEIDTAIDLLEVTFKRYSLVVTGNDSDPVVPLERFDVRADLKLLWPG